MLLNQNDECTALKAMPHDNDLRNNIIDDATSTTKFNNCEDIVQTRHVNLQHVCL